MIHTWVVLLCKPGNKVSIYVLRFDTTTLCLFCTLSFICTMNCGSKVKLTNVNCTDLLQNTTLCTNDRSNNWNPLSVMSGAAANGFWLSTDWAWWIWWRTGQNKPLLWLFSQFLHVLTHCISSGPLSYHSNWPFTHFPSHSLPNPALALRTLTLSLALVNMSREP